MSVGKIKSRGRLNCQNENGCGVEECIYSESADFLFIPEGMFMKDDKTFVRADYFCGVGLGNDDKNDDGLDNGNVVFSQASSPVVLRFLLVWIMYCGSFNVCFRFETDNVKGEVEEESNQQQQMMLKNEAGWMLDYSFQQACTSLKP